MSQVIWKFKFEVIDGEQPFDLYLMTVHEAIVSMQGQNVCLWQRLFTDEKPIKAIGKIVGTGHPFEEEWKWIGSAFDPRGFVWHLIFKM